MCAVCRTLIFCFCARFFLFLDRSRLRNLSLFMHIFFPCHHPPRSPSCRSLPSVPRPLVSRRRTITSSFRYNHSRHTRSPAPLDDCLTHLTVTMVFSCLVPSLPLTHTLSVSLSLCVSVSLTLSLSHTLSLFLSPSLHLSHLFLSLVRFSWTPHVTA